MKKVLKIVSIIAVIAVVLHILGNFILVVIGLSEYIKSFFPDKQILCEDIASSTNYNNISAGHTTRWISDNEVYLSETIAFLTPYYKITKKGKKRIAFVGDSQGYGVQAHGDKIYVHDLSGNKMVRIREYLDSTKEKTATIKAPINSSDSSVILEQCLIVDNNAYILTDGDTKKLTRVSLNSTSFEEICSGVISAGVMNKSVVYITKSDSIYTVSKYNPETNSADKIGEFFSDIYTSGFFDEVNYTSNNIILFHPHYTENNTRIVVYNCEYNTLKDFTVNIFVDLMVAYEDSAFCVAKTEVHNENAYKNKNTLYKINIDDFSLEKIDDIEGIVEMFVTSDDDVYVWASSFEGIRHYKSNGEFSQIIKSK